MTPALKYGTIEWEEAFLKNRKTQEIDFKKIYDIARIFNPINQIFYVIRCKSSGKYMAGDYPGAFRWNFKLESALLYNGVFDSEKSANEWFISQSEIYGKECQEVEFIQKKMIDPDVSDIIKGKIRSYRW